jgi:hypothetical protein
VERDQSAEGAGGGNDADDSVADGLGESAKDAPAPGPSFEPEAGTIERNSLRRFGARDTLFKNFASSYVTEDADELTQPYLEDLADASAPVGDPDTVTECGQQVIDSQENPTLPAYAGYGELDERDVLMMGFVYSAENSGPLDKFMLWIWPRDDCSIPNEYQFGTIHP